MVISHLQPLLPQILAQLTKPSSPHLYIPVEGTRTKHVNYIQIIDMQGNTIDREVIDLCPYTGVGSSSLHDLVCMYGEHNNIYVRNPATRYQITLPAKSCSLRDSYGYHDKQVAISYVSSMSVYKVVEVVRMKNITSHVGGRIEIAFTCEVLTLGSSEQRRHWRGIGGPPFDVSLDSMVVMDDAIHLLPHHKPEQRINELKGIARFDLRKEEWSMHRFPDAFYNAYKDNPMDKWLTRLSRLGGRLCLECLGNIKLELWLLRGNDIGGKWVKEYSIDISMLWWPYCIRSVAMEEDGKVLLKMAKGRLQYYDRSNGRFHEIFASGTRIQASLYQESFMHVS